MSARIAGPHPCMPRQQQQAASEREPAHRNADRESEEPKHTDKDSDRDMIGRKALADPLQAGCE